MKNHRHAANLAIGAILIGFLIAPRYYVHGNSTYPGQEPQVDQTYDRAIAIPTSDNLVQLQIIIEGRVIKATQREGGLIRIEHEGKIYGITPHIQDINE